MVKELQDPHIHAWFGQPKLCEDILKVVSEFYKSLFMYLYMNYYFAPLAYHEVQKM